MYNVVEVIVAAENKLADCLNGKSDHVVVRFFILQWVVIQTTLLFDVIYKKKKENPNYLSKNALANLRNLGYNVGCKSMKEKRK